MDIRVVVMTSDSYLWALQPFSYLFNVYWSTLQPVVVVGSGQPPFELPGNFLFHSLGPFSFPKERWSDQVIEFLKILPDDLFVLMLEDYWLCRLVDNSGVNSLVDYMAMHPDVLRMDLTTDRLYAGGMKDIEAWGHYDILETAAGTPYQMSLQAGIWNRRLMQRLLVPGKTPWEVETDTSPPEEMRVRGTRQSPVRYVNAFRGGNPEKPLNLEGIPSEHLDEMRRRGWLA